MDCILKNGKDVEGNPLEVAIKDGKIAAIGPNLDVKATITLDLKNKSYISAGWIDDHVHCNDLMDLYFDTPDKIGINCGVTTIIDAGSTGADNFPEFWQRVRHAKTNVLALLNISETGIITQDELSDLRHVNQEKVVAMLEKYKGKLVGLKARMSQSVVGENGVKPLYLAKKIQEKVGSVPLMVHVGSAPPKLNDILEYLDKGDVMTHCFNGKENSILDGNGKIHPFVWDAYKKGVIFDLGHGFASFSFDVARKAFQQGLTCYTISTDIYQRNRLNGPVFDMAHTLDKMRLVGYSLAEVIAQVTRHPAQVFGLKNKGNLEVGCDGDLTVFDVADTPRTLVDSGGVEETVATSIVPRYAIVAGHVYAVGESHE